MNILPKSGGEQTLIELDPPRVAQGTLLKELYNLLYGQDNRPWFLHVWRLEAISSQPSCRERSKHSFRKTRFKRLIKINIV